MVRARRHCRVGFVTCVGGHSPVSHKNASNNSRGMPAVSFYLTSWVDMLTIKRLYKMREIFKNPALERNIINITSILRRKK